MYKLIIEDDEGKITNVPLVRNELSIGRAEENTIRLDERNVSRKHAILSIKEGRIFIKDLKSYNGVWINGDPIDGEVELLPGDLLEIGDYHLTIEDSQQTTDDKVRPSLPADTPQATPPTGLTSFTEDDNKSTLVDDTVPAQLTILTPPLAKKKFLLTKNQIQIGRTEDNDISIDHPSVSRYHARIEKKASGYRIVDLDSANGICVNGEEYVNCDLRWGDIIELGNVQIRFDIPTIDDDQDDDPTPTNELRSSKLPDTTKVVSSSSQHSTLKFVIVALALVLIISGFVLINILSNTKVSKKKKISPPVLRQDPSLLMFKKAEKALSENRFERALHILEKLLAKQPHWKEAALLKKQATFEAKNRDLLNEGVTLLAEKKWKQAYDAFSKIHEESRFFAQAEQEKLQIIEKLRKFVKKAIEKKRYNEALQQNQLLLDLLPNDEQVQGVHRKIQLLLIDSNDDSEGVSTPSFARKVPLALRKKHRKRRKKRLKKKSSRKKRSTLRRQPLQKRTTLSKKKKRKKSKDFCLNLYRNKQLRRAKYCYLQRLKKRPRSSFSHFMLGSILSKLGYCNKPSSSKYEPRFCFSAMDHYKSYLRLNPKGKYAERLRRILGKKHPPKQR